MALAQSNRGKAREALKHLAAHANAQKLEVETGSREVIEELQDVLREYYLAAHEAMEAICQEGRR